MSRTSRASRRRRAGTASVEVVVMLPLFLIAYSGIYYMYGHYMGRQQALLRARSCGLTYAAGGCADKDTLDRCLANPPRSPAPDGAEREPHATAVLPDDSARAETEVGGVGESGVSQAIEKLEKIPVLGDAIKWLLGKPVTVHARKLVHLSKSSLATGDITIGADYHTMCNSVSRRWEQVAKDIFCNFVGKFPGCPDP